MNIEELLLEHALKFGNDWASNILNIYTNLAAQRADRDGNLPEAEETLYQQLHQWIQTTIKAGAVHRGLDWNRL